MKTKIYNLLFAVCVLAGFASCVDNDDDVSQNFYESTKMTAAQFLDANEDRLGEFIQLLKRTPYYSMLSMYGNYTVFAPTNEAMDAYLRQCGYQSVDDIPTAICDTLARTHLVDGIKAYFTTEVGEGTLDEPNMADSKITLRLDSDQVNNNALLYYVNKTSLMVEYDDSVTNGVVHIVNRFIERSNEMLPDIIGRDSTLQLFYQALKVTGMADSLMLNEDESYVWGNDDKTKDSLYNGIMIKSQTLNDAYTRSKWPEHRYFKYTAFVEPDSVFHAHNIFSIADLEAYAKQVYDASYPEDAGLYDNNPKHRKNPLNRFVSYHLLDRGLIYDQIIMTKKWIETHWDCSKLDPDEYLETMCPNTIMRFAYPDVKEMFINRKGVGYKKVQIPGVKILSEAESGLVNQDALNGYYYYIDDILVYDKQTREDVLNCRMRIDGNTLSPDFYNCNRRGNPDQGALFGLRSQYIKNWKVMGTDVYIGLHSDEGYFNSFKSNNLTISGNYDVTMKLPPVPVSGTYELRLGYTSGGERDVIQFYIVRNGHAEPCGIPVDQRIYSTDPSIGAVDDLEGADEDSKSFNRAIDKAMRNHGFMKGPSSYGTDLDHPLRKNSWNIRRILTTDYFDANETYYLRCRKVLEDPESYWAFDYIELCPKSVFGSAEGEDDY